MNEVKIHSGTRIKLKRIQEEALPPSFVSRLKEFAHGDDRIQAVFIFAIETEAAPAQPCLSIAVKSGFFAGKNDGFLQIVDEVQLFLPDDLAVKIYRFGESETLTRYCLDRVDPVYLRSAAWLQKQRKKYS
jgi:hypothetical protein